MKAHQYDTVIYKSTWCSIVHVFVEPNGWRYDLMAHDFSKYFELIHEDDPDLHAVPKGPAIAELLDAASLEVDYDRAMRGI